MRWGVRRRKDGSGGRDRGTGEAGPTADRTAAGGPTSVDSGTVGPDGTDAGTPGAGVSSLVEFSGLAEAAGRAGRPAEAVSLYRAMVDAARAVRPPDDPLLLSLRHQLAHWTGESGQPGEAVEMFARLLADREAQQGPRHQDTVLARHQLAHWYGRSGRTEEAARRYAEMHAEAAREGRMETAMDLLCNAAYWQQEGGDTASALRTYTRMLEITERELGPTHQSAAVARQRYAALAGDLPFGHDRGHDSLRDLIVVAHQIGLSGDPRRAGRMYGRVAEMSEYLYGVASSQALDAWTAQAAAAVTAGDAAEASEAYGRVLDCMALRGEGPGTSDYDNLVAQRDKLTRAAAKKIVRLAEPAAELLAGQVTAAPGTAFGLLLRPAGALAATRVRALRDRVGGFGPDALGPEQWAALREDLAEQGLEAVALYAARAGRRPAPGEADLAERLALPYVHASDQGDGTVALEGTAFEGGEPRPVQVVVDPEEQPRPEPVVPRGRMPFNPNAEALDGWVEVKRAQPARAADGPAAFGPYTVLELVGEGGFGRVYLCQDADGIMVAVKTLHERHAVDPDLREDFAHEVGAARRVESRFTVPVVAADTDGPVPWMAVPYVAAPSLKELARVGPLDEQTVRVLGAGIAGALTAIHGQGIVHLDLKPGNVLLTEDGPRVIDFGIAQIERLTEPRRGFAGTYRYASPEQLREEPRFTPASDVFSLGTMLAELALGRSPWGDGGAWEVKIRVCTGAPDLAGLPPGLDRVVRHCLRPDPAGRPTPAEVAAALRPDTPEGSAATLPPLARELVREHATSTGGTLVLGLSARAGSPTAVVPEPAQTVREATRAMARNLGLRVQRWEADPGRSHATPLVREELAAFLDEARALLGAQHPLTLRLELSHALLAAVEPDGRAALSDVLRRAATRLGEGHPAVQQARTLLEALTG
ncbi:protein kinase [Streptomyces sp. KK5PA1]|uniref:Protein kinase n=1 Tax=Actinacidiphila acididurans TaxID=2784346 RepID=A0ABS2TZG1_9ACTN|nr:protein kinase [Actinacidiphila acididurans]